MTQTSAPLIGVEFPDDAWRTLAAADTDGILGDPAGTASYSLTLPTSGNNVTVGVGAARVAGFLHQVTASESITIPAPTSRARTDVITARYDATWANDGGARPVRLNRVAGTEGSGTPTLDTSPPGVQELPLWRITRSPSQALNLATVVDMRRWVRPDTITTTSANKPVAPWVGQEIRCTDTGTEEAWTGSAWSVVGSWQRSSAALLASHGTAAGGTPPVTGQALIVAGTRVVTLDANGAATVTFPTPFPTGLIAVTVSGADEHGGSNFAGTDGGDRLGFVVRGFVMRTDGTLALKSNGFTLSYVAIGW